MIKMMLDGEMEVIVLELDSDGGGSTRARILREDTGKEWWVNISRLKSEVKA